jgi:phosphatidylglycerophosphate synthase
MQTSILAPLERRVLLRLAHRLPRGVSPDHLTALALAAMAAAGVSYWLARWNRLALLMVVSCLAINWFGYSLDGTLARTRCQQRPRFGFYVDHLSDAFGALFLLTGLALSGYMSPSVSAGLLITYLLVSIEVYLAAYSLSTFRISFWKVGPTELRILLAVGNVVLLYHPTTDIFGERYLLFDVGGVIAIATLAITLVISAAQNVRALYRAEPVPLPSTRATARGNDGKERICHDVC